MADDENGKVVDIKTRKRITNIPTDADTQTSQFLKTWTKFCRDTKVQSIMIVTIDENSYVTWGFLSEDEHHVALAALTLEDLREEIREELFGDSFEEEE